MSFDLIIRGGEVLDGNGGEPFPADVGVVGDRITAVGDLSAAVAADQVDASGHCVAPGFIDSHNHSDGHLVRKRQQTWKLTQGFATEVLMSDGISYAPVEPSTWAQWMYYLRGLNGLRVDEYQGWRSIDDFMRRTEGGWQNAAALIPYANVRTLACGFGRATPDDLQTVQIQSEIRQAMDLGAVGLSSGLDYIAQCFATTDELIAACRAIAPRDGVYVTHIRYKLGLLEAIQEAFDICRRAGVRLHISHLKTLSDIPFEQVFELLESEGRDVDYSFDVYPYQPGSTMLNYLLPYEVWEDGPLRAAARLTEPAMMERFRRIIDSFRLPLDSLRIAWTPGRDSDIQGATLAEYIESVNAPPADALARLLIETRFAPLLVFLEGDDRLVEPFLQHERYLMGSDGIYFDGGVVHPRVYGSAARLLGPMVRDQKLFSLGDAVRRLTSYPADRFGLKDRGRVVKGACADLTVFDPATIQDCSTYDDPHQDSIGVREVIVNGRFVLRDGTPADPTDSGPGRYLTKPTD